MQTKTDSIKECLYNLITGLLISWALTHLLFWAYSVEARPGTQEQFVGWFTLASFLRQYAIRRYRVWQDHRKKEKMREGAAAKIADMIHRRDPADDWKQTEDIARADLVAAVDRFRIDGTIQALFPEPVVKIPVPEPELTDEVKNFDTCPAPDHTVIAASWPTMSDVDKAFWHKEFGSLPRVER